jgi:hypothetical protein
MTTLAARAWMSPGNARAGVSREQLGQLLDVAARTIDRWEKGETLAASGNARSWPGWRRSPPWDGCLTDEGFRRFLVTPLPALGGRSALAAVGLVAGRVFDLLSGLYEGEPA